MPEAAVAVVVFAQGSGSSRHSPRNRQVAERLQREGLGILLLDLLTESEDVVDLSTGQFRFDIGLLADRLGDALADVRAPTLLIVGGRDEAVADLNRQASKRLRAEHRVEVVPDATHLFEEPGALGRVTALSASWFVSHLVEAE